MRFATIAQPLLAVSALAAPALMQRDLATIQSAIQTVEGALGKLSTAVDSVSGSDPNSLQALLTASTDGQKVIQTATQQVSGTSTLSLSEALSLQQTATGLIASVNKTVGGIVAKKPVFEQLGVTSVVAQNLQAQKTGSEALGKAIISKIPSIGQGIAQQSIGQISTQLDNALKAFGGASGATPPAGKPAVADPPPVTAGVKMNSTAAGCPAAASSPPPAAGQASGQSKANAGGLAALLGGAGGLTGGAGGLGGLADLLGGAAGGAGGAGGLGGLADLLGGAAGGAGGAGGLADLLGGLLGGAGGGGGGGGRI